MQFFPTQYSTLSSKSLLNLVIDSYSIDINSTIIFLKRGFNDTYLITNGNRKYIFRVYKFDWRSFESIEAELKLLLNLKENTISVSFPLKDKSGNFIQTIEAVEGKRYAVLFSFAEGEQVRKLSIAQANLLGKQTARIHLSTKNFVLENTAQNYEIENQFEETLRTLKPFLKNHTEQYDYLVKLKNSFIEKFNAIDKNELSKGICHGDLQAENFHINHENEITFFDFDFFGKGYLAYDIGVFIWYDHKNKTPEIVKSFLEGYNTKRVLTKTEIELLPYFSTLRALFQMTLYCQTNDGIKLPLWNPQEVANFISKIEKWFVEKTTTSYHY